MYLSPVLLVSDCPIRDLLWAFLVFALVKLGSESRTHSSWLYPFADFRRYKREELPFRISIFYSGYTLSSAFGGLIAAGIIGNMDGIGGYQSWRWLFLIEGAATVLAAFPAFYLLPNYPTTTSWLSAEERALAEYRLSLEADGEEDTVKGSVMKGLKQALIDPKVWLLVLIQTCAVIGMSFTVGSTRIPSPVDTNLLVLLPFHRSNPWVFSNHHPPTHGASVLCSLPVLTLQLVALIQDE